MSLVVCNCKKDSIVEPNTNTVTDIDGNVYHTVTIGTQVWMVENLKTTKYNDGTNIPNVTDNTAWANLTTPAYCWYSNDIANKTLYGGLYNWYTVNIGKLAPKGWHVPTDEEWTKLTDFLGGKNVAGKYLSEKGSTHWDSPNSESTNESGFTALPGGCMTTNGEFNFIGSGGLWWSSTIDQYYERFSWYRVIHSGSSIVERSAGFKEFPMSVRCIRDLPAKEDPSNLINLPNVKLNDISDITASSVIIAAEVISQGKSSITNRGICISKSSNPTIENGMVYKVDPGIGVYAMSVNSLESNTTYYVRPFASNLSGTGYGKEDKFTTLNAPQKPNNVDYFTIDVSRQKILISSVYIPLMKQYKLTVQEYSKVEYKWNCSDKSVYGLIVSTRAFTPTDGELFSNSYSQTFAPSGTKLFQKWEGLPGYLQLYIQSYNSKYIYSKDYLMVQVMIDGVKNYEIWSDKPNL